MGRSFQNSVLLCRAAASARALAILLAGVIVLSFGCGAGGEGAKGGSRGTLFILGDSYAHFSAPHMKDVARDSGCRVGVDDLFAHSGWTARMFLENEWEWGPAIESAPAPVIVYLTIGFNDLFRGGDPTAVMNTVAAEVEDLIRRLARRVKPGGGEVIQIGYDDIWSLPDHQVTYMGETHGLSRVPSEPLALYYGMLPNAQPSYRFVDVRGWLGEALWTDDGIHLVERNHAEQARLLWDRVFGPVLGCGGGASGPVRDAEASRATHSRGNPSWWL